jgi:cytochrome c-type biogenesis protein CcmH/NrfF
MRHALKTIIIAALALTALAATTATAATPRASFTDIEDEVMCISCNVALNIAESPQADRQRALIRDLVDKGLTKDQIKDRLVAEYGANVLALPDNSGFGLAAYLVPIAVAVGLAGLALMLLPRWRRRPPSGPAGDDAPALSSADARRLDDDLARYDV